MRFDSSLLKQKSDKIKHSFFPLLDILFCRHSDLFLLRELIYANHAYFYDFVHVVS